MCGVGGFRGLGCVALGCGWVGVWRVGGFRGLGWVGTETSVTLDPHGGFGLGCVGVWGGGWVEGWVGTETHPGPTWHRVKEVHLVYSLAMFVEGCDVKAIAMTLT